MRDRSSWSPVTVKPDGNSYVVVLPTYIRRELGILPGQMMLLRRVGNCVVMTKFEPNPNILIDSAPATAEQAAQEAVAPSA